MAPPPVQTLTSFVPTGCCPPFDPRPWDGTEHVWHDKLFVKEHVLTLFHVPLNMSKVIVGAKLRIETAGAEPRQPLMLADDRSAWGSDLYLEVTKPVEGMTLAPLSGTFLTRVFEGPFKDAPRWIADMKSYVAQKGQTIERLYLAYTTCPACAKAYGKNQVVVFARVAPSA
jgi:hypothetical protein